MGYQFFKYLIGVVVFFWRTWLNLIVSTTTNLSVIHYFDIPNPGVQIAFELLRDNEIIIDRTKTIGELCLLTMEEEQDIVIPVARSYDTNSWERSGGRHAEKLNAWACTNRTCRTVMPKGKRFVLRSRLVPNESVLAQTARFLEAASFGPTRGTMEAFPGVYKYLKEQMADVPPTFHREFFRRRVNAPWRGHSAEFGVRDNPCDGQPFTTWRRHALSTRDVDHHLTTMRVGYRWQISVDGTVRSMPLSFRFQDNDAPEFIDGEAYRICSSIHDLRRAKYALSMRGKCLAMVPADMMVSFHDNFTAPYIIDLPSLAGNDDWVPTDVAGDRFVLTTPVLGCTGLEKRSNQMIYGRTQDGVWFLYDSTVELQENSLSSPLTDAGRSLWLENRTEYCSNVPRTFLNEASCTLSSVACTHGSGKNYTEATQRDEYVVCGSPGEVANEPMLGDHWFNISLSNDDPPNEVERQRENVWSTIALKSPDQLRQRVAWALFQLFALPKSALNDERRTTEAFLNYYDIFVRNAFTNFKNILREITYNPLMATSLSYINSVSIAYGFERNEKLIFPDENFARELMQLFTIGLYELNDDGTPRLDGKNRTIRTYNSEHIESFAKVWTGFGLQGRRANIEGYQGNYIDPMKLSWEKRDILPKSDLLSGFLGDGYPLCEDLPERPFLRAGAKYRILGSSAEPEMVYEENGVSTSPDAKRLVLDPLNSQLYTKLCVKTSADDQCHHPSIVVLDMNLVCVGNECVDTVKVVKVDNTFYEYIENIPCVELAFFENGVKLSNKWKAESGLCANPKLASAGTACCQGSDDTARTSCVYAGERTRFNTSKQRCEDSGGRLCDYGRTDDTDGCPRSGYQWTSLSCTVAAKINSIGQVALVHNVTNPRPLVKENSPSFFNVPWLHGLFPSVSNNCGEGACRKIDGEDACLCSTSLENVPVFESPPSSSSDILSNLRIGYANPTMYDDGRYTQLDINGYRLYTIGASCCGIDTVFEVLDENLVVRRYRNMNSSVHIPSSAFSFRNPVHFNSIVFSEGSTTKAHHEVDALLNHLFYHHNTPVFLARHLIQRFGVSNPSPSYVRTVASAFRNGFYFHKDGDFGTGTYGDMAATVAALLSDKEARGQALQGDPFHGSLREPIIKVVAFMRAMDFETTAPIIELDLLEEKIGEAPYEQQTVFSFFQTDYSPPGETSVGALAAPEAQVMSSGKTVGLLNGLFALIQRNGLSACDNGLGVACWDDSSEDGLQFVPTQPSDRKGSLRELSLLLTSDRISEKKIEDMYSATLTETSDIMAWKRGLQLIVLTPEFHSTNILDSIPQARTKQKKIAQESRLSTTYKAVIHLVLRGGCDSFNMLVPHPSCSDLSASYKETRDSIALPDDSVIEIRGDTSGQPCSRFGLHRELGLLKQLYDDGDLSFLANVGVLTKPVDKTNYLDETATNLFAHNAMQEEVDKLDPLNAARGTGTLGRIADKVFSKGYRISRTTVESSSKNLAGRSSSPPPVFTLDQNGVIRLADINLSSPIAQDEIIGVLNGQYGGNRSGVFGELWSSLLQRSQNQTEQTYYLLRTNNPTAANFTRSALGKRFKLISQLIALRKERGVDRDFFFVEYDGWDHHPEVIRALSAKFTELNTELTNLVSELKALNVWENVAILETSEFARTLTPNSGGGSDHGWGGNYILASGQARGKKILGRYPKSFSLDDDLNIGRGRLLPTTPWDSIFNAIAQWMGVDNSESDLDDILPNRRNFQSLYNASDLFE